MAPDGDLYQARLFAELARDLEGIRYLWLQQQITGEQASEMLRRAELVHESLLAVADTPFRIWREDIRGRVRYIARARRLDVNPHTVVTADVGELRAILMAAPS